MTLVAEITFGTDGWRSTVDEDFNEENVALVTQGICNYLYEKEMAQKGCVIGYDTRRTPSRSRTSSPTCS